MRFRQSLILFVLVLFGLSIAGCNWFNTNNRSRPAPVRPRMTSPRPSPLKSPTGSPSGITSITEKQLTQRIDTIEREIKRGNWAAANRETNALGIDMTRFRPTKSKGKSLREIASFDAIYTKLQANCKTKNKNAALGDLKRLREALKTQTHKSGAA